MAEQTGSGASLADFIWKNAEDLWGDFKHTDFGKIICRSLCCADWSAFWSRPAKEVRESHALSRIRDRSLT
jgi:type I restriction enzyme M protein